jgi:hypothetical protein
MGRLGDARTWVLLTSGYSLALSVGFFGTSMRLDQRVFAGYAAITGIFYLAIILAAPRLLASPRRRWWFAIAALINIAICSFGQLAGFVFYAAPLTCYLTLFMMPYGVAPDKRRFGAAGDGAAAAARSVRGRPDTSTP